MKMEFVREVWREGWQGVIIGNESGRSSGSASSMEPSITLTRMRIGLNSFIRIEPPFYDQGNRISFSHGL
jgi:hypothetical protein